MDGTEWLTQGHTALIIRDRWEKKWSRPSGWPITVPAPAKHGHYCHGTWPNTLKMEGKHQLRSRRQSSQVSRYQGHHRTDGLDGVQERLWVCTKQTNTEMLGDWSHTTREDIRGTTTDEGNGNSFSSLNDNWGLRNRMDMIQIYFLDSTPCKYIKCSFVFGTFLLFKQYFFPVFPLP